jgi:hypothetical protein
MTTMATTDDLRVTRQRLRLREVVRGIGVGSAAEDQIPQDVRAYGEAKSWRSDKAKAARDGKLSAPTKRTVQRAPARTS